MNRDIHPADKAADEVLDEMAGRHGVDMSVAREAVRLMRERWRAEDECPTCGAPGFEGDGSMLPVWESVEDYEAGLEPDYLGCTDCGTMREADR